MADPRHGSYKDLVRLHEDELESLLRQGTFKPVLLYQLVLVNLLPLLGLVIPRHWGGKYIKIAIFALNLGIALEVLKSYRSQIGGNGYMIGLMTAWSLVWSAGLLVFTDVETDFQRIERGTAASSSEDESIRNKTKNKFKSETSTPTENGQEDKDKLHSKQVANFHWQPYPRKLSHRLGWCAGLLFNLRGPEWNWRAPHLGPLPRSVHSQIHAGFISDKFKSKAQDDATYPSAKDRLKQAFRTFLISYLLLDCLKVIMMRDPYFRGTSMTGPQPFPLSYIEPFPILIRFYRVFTSAAGVYVSLNYATSLNPIFFLGLSLAFPNASRKLMAAPLDASWLYANSFGPFFKPLLDHGLAGCWGRWWHQLFRSGFTMAAEWILSMLPTRMARDTQVKRIIHVAVAFSISGFIHACGSHAQFTATKPLSGPFLFFFLQIFAITGEYLFKAVIFPSLPLPKPSKGLKMAGNATFTFCWLLFSGASIADDFARGGLWLVEPIPISPLRGLGLAYESGWWCWKSSWFRYWSDGTYWGSGIRVV